VSLPRANQLPLESASGWPMRLEELGMFIGWERREPPAVPPLDNPTYNPRT
jgi:hypothetical protein